MAKVKRWSKKPDWEEHVIGTGVKEGVDVTENVEIYMIRVCGFADILRDSVRYMKEKKYQLDVVLESMAEMYDEWIDCMIETSNDFADPTLTLREALAWHRDNPTIYGSLYESSNEPKKLHDALTKLTDQGYDVRSYWRKYRDALSEIWKLIPEFYKAERTLSGKNHESYPAYTEKPKDYDPDRPFPQYPYPKI